MRDWLLSVTAIGITAPTSGRMTCISVVWTNEPAGYSGAALLRRSCGVVMQ